jgi:hypothetical protein
MNSALNTIKYKTNVFTDDRQEKNDNAQCNDEASAGHQGIAGDFSN